ncbi:TAP-like protein-domain-containing protein [Rhizoctonia solani]|nr:TAP-like protein-domain-containing protein [Rhizoctonia solani]
MALARFFTLFVAFAFFGLAKASVIPLSDGYHRYPTRNKDLKWSNCSLDNFPGRECARFEVPLDWHKETVGKASLAVIRYRAVKAPRLGILFMNPGGPGISGIETMQGPIGGLMMQSSGGQYDVVSWDPRGVGKSTPRSTCFRTTEEDIAFWNGSLLLNGPETRGGFTSETNLDEFYGQIKEVDDLLTRFGEQCAAYNPNAFKYVGTAATVRDMVAMHDTIEGYDKPINFWGVSYGTVIGMYFVNMFPDRVGRVVIDGVINPTNWANRPAYEYTGVALQSIDETFDGFAAACAKAGPSRCAIADQNSTEASIRQWTRNLINAAYDYRRVTGPSAALSSASIRSAIFRGLYTPQSWPDLAQKLGEAAVFLSNPTSVKATQAKRWLATSVSTVGNQHKPRNQPDTTEETHMYANEAITCADSQDAGSTTTKEVFDHIVNITRKVSPMFGPIAVLGSATYCHRWPVRAVERYTGPWNKRLSNPILVLGNKLDPVTPYLSAKHVADALGISAVLVEQNAFGHSSLAVHSNCTSSVLERYFLHNQLPQKGLLCETNEELFSKTGIPNSIISDMQRAN